ncbi:MAG: hypothetical protein K9I34_01840 [Bacteroidales bacterium]|nr:hypothetical protein [Bacteroidales bacterium]
MASRGFIYFFNYDDNERDLCKLESKYIFGEEETKKVLYSERLIDPSSSAFIKRRLDIIAFSANYPACIEAIRQENITAEGFKVEYIHLEGDANEYADRLAKLKDIGYSIEGLPDYHNPVITYALCYYKEVWYFGELIKNSFEWHNHKQKPCSYSNSISQLVAKALINLATNANPAIRLLDACCGVGTIMLEACFAGFPIEGCDINEKICQDGRENLAHFGYEAVIYHADIKDLGRSYDAAIVDLPYNLFSFADDATILHIIESTAAIASRVVFVSTSDIAPLIDSAGLILKDSCSVVKRRKANFTRRIWVCEAS